MTARSPIDVHTHVVPSAFPAYLGKGRSVPWPSMAAGNDACHQHVMVAGKVFRTVSDCAWDTKRRLVDMDRSRIGVQVLSPMPELLSYWLEAGDAGALLRFVNEEIAAMVATAPHRFVGLGAVPLQDIRLAVAELEHAIGTLGLAGVEIAGNINGKPIGAPEFAPFWSAAETLGAAVFIHPLRPTGMDRLAGPSILEQVLAFPSETGLALASLMTGGVLDRHPRLRVAASHGGGSFHALLSRLQFGWETFAGLREAMPTAPGQLARRLYVDSLVYNVAGIRSLIDCFGDTQVMIGSDYPFAIQEVDPVGRIDALPSDNKTQESLLWRNAQRWLGIP